MSILSRQRILFAVSLAAIATAGLAPRIAQNPEYHLFADGNSYLSIPNALNVLTNLLFAWVGGEGLYRLLRQKSLHIMDQIRHVYSGFFAALIMIAVGSIYYHWSPDNFSLALDRLPIAIGFMSFFTIMLGERISIALARRLYPVLIVAAIASVAYWQYSEHLGQGDLRLYALVVFAPILLTVLMLIMFPPRFTRTTDIWWVFTWYLVAKLCELFDHQIYNWLIVLSGHSLKHIAAGIACLVFLRHLRFRRALES